MKKRIVSIAALALVFVLAAAMLTGCGGEKTTTITVFNWFDYIDESVIAKFEEETGIKVNYTNFTTTEEAYAKLEKGAGAYDVIVPSDYIIERMIKNDMLAELDLSVMPNVANLLDWCRTPDYDPEGKYSVAYMWGTVGILYDTTKVEKVTSWSVLFDPQYQQEVYMMDSIRDSFGVSLKYLGYSVNNHEETALSEVRDLLVKQKADGIVAGYLVDETKDKMIAGEAAMAVMWSGDALYAMAENENLDYVVPEEGSNVWLDAMCIPKSSKNKEAAMKFIDFMCRPDIAELNQAYIYYSSPIKQVVEGYDEEELVEEALNPSQEVLDRCEFFNDLSDYMDLYDKLWMEIRA